MVQLFEAGLPEHAVFACTRAEEQRMGKCRKVTLIRRQNMMRASQDERQAGIEVSTRPNLEVLRRALPHRYRLSSDSREAQCQVPKSWQMDHEAKKRDCDFSTYLQVQQRIMMMRLRRV